MLSVLSQGASFIDPFSNILTLDYLHSVSKHLVLNACHVSGTVQDPWDEKINKA